MYFILYLESIYVGLYILFNVWTSTDL